MPISDSKKVASAINHMGGAILKCRTAHADMLAIIVKFNAANPSVIDTPLQGNKAAVLAAVTSLGTEINTPLWDGVVAAIVPSHRGKALD